MSRPVKRFLYGALYFVFLAFVVSWFFPQKGPATPPSPFPSEPKPLEIQSAVTIMTAADGSVAFFARARNPNGEYLADPFPYSFVVKRAGNVVEETPLRTGVAYPGESAALLEIVRNPTLTEDTTVELKLGAPSWKDASFSVRPAVTMGEQSVARDAAGMIAEGTVANTGSVAAGSISIIALLKDAAGFPLFAAQTELMNVPGGVTEPFFIRFPRDEGLATRAVAASTEFIVSAR